jgi:peptidoglycan/LPS O-acetylase OafA/YrhL
MDVAPKNNLDFIRTLLALGVLSFHNKASTGDPSLGIYVFHFPILTWLKAHGVAGFPLYPATLFLTVTLALVSWHAVEKRALSKE